MDITHLYTFPGPITVLNICFIFIISQIERFRYPYGLLELGQAHVNRICMSQEHLSHWRKWYRLGNVWCQWLSSLFHSPVRSLQTPTENLQRVHTEVGTFHKLPCGERDVTIGNSIETNVWMTPEPTVGPKHSVTQLNSTQLN